ncbi:sulfur carrier protein ThiS [Bacillus sp. FJAT-27251]|uniref:sulfur carrier protein ThiS n=1 Tax=Bacillus sp. FJAT-27251 TaxID=1684142 RepID=UPI0006A7D590|nr:sulfur carrier protein ThiS [Bacillus sp. FJAT-27251]
MQLTINGETVSVPSSVGNVSQLLKHYGINQKVAIVELNQDILEKSRHGETALADGDKIEIVHFVGGG